MQIIELSNLYIYEGIAGKKYISKDSYLMQDACRRIDNILLRVGKNTKKLFQLIIIRLQQMYNIDKIICSIICLYIKGFNDIVNYYESVILYNQLYNINKFKL